MDYFKEEKVIIITNGKPGSLAIKGRKTNVRLLPLKKSLPANYLTPHTLGTARLHQAASQLLEMCSPRPRPALPTSCDKDNLACRGSHFHCTQIINHHMMRQNHNRNACLGSVCDGHWVQQERKKTNNPGMASWRK